MTADGRSRSPDSTPDRASGSTSDNTRESHPGLARARRGFAGYDWAGSGYVTVVTTAVGGPYLDALATGAASAALVLPATLVVAVLVQVVLLPLVGRAVDRGQDPAVLLRTFALLGGLATLAFAVAPTWQWAALAMATTTVCLGASMVPYNALLPRLAPGTAADALSARAFATGYVGGGLLLALALGLLASGAVDQATGVRAAIVAAGLWWAGFALLACRALAAAPAPTPAAESERVGVLRLLRDLPQLRRALLGALLLGDAVGAVVALSATVLTHELWTARGLPAAAATSTLLGMVLLIQVLAAPAALLVGRLAARVGTLPVLLGCVGGWLVVLVGAYTALDEVRDVWVLAVGVAVVLGGTQTLSRSLVAQCTPPAHAGAVFAVSQLAERGTAWMGPALFGVVVAATGSYRGALLSLVALFALAAAVLVRLRPAEGVAQAASYDAAACYERRRLAVPDARVPATAGRALYAAVAATAGLVLRALADVRTTGPALPAGGVVVVANHRSVLDGPLLAVVGRRRGRQLRMLGTAGVFTAPLLGPALLSVGMVPVKRRTASARAALAGAERMLRAGEAVALFPEGRIHDATDGLPQELRGGAARLALATGAPVVVVGVHGAERVVPPGTWRPVLGRRARLEVRVGAPVDLLAALGLPGPQTDPDAATVAAANDVLHGLLTQAVQAAQGTPASRPLIRA